ncbi:MAG: DUF2807 domain-containing protein [Flavobacteriia bacterium]|nr:DUF2807 domain-containing protein [Flavobacteriia bacterium]
MKYLTLLTISLLLLACKKPEDRKCFKFIGIDTLKELTFENFDKLKLYENVKYILIQDSTNKVILKGGKNLLNEIKIDYADNIIEIKNKNRCNFLRNYSKKVTAEIHFTSLQNIEYTGTENLTNIGQLKFEYFALSVCDGAGSVNLNIDSKVIKALVTGGNGDFTLSGKVNFGMFTINGNGFCNTYNLDIVDSIGVITNSSAPVKINTSFSKFKYEIKKNGDLYYKGSPSSVQSNIYGVGKLICDN